MQEAVENGTTITREHITVEIGEGQVQHVTIIVGPMALRRDQEPLYMILFKDEGAAFAHADPADHRPAERSGEDVAHLERELRDTKERLQSLIEEYETALEELKSSNEELVSVNEEMQSTNEEMEASKEELQSVNEELHTVNTELHSKVEALDRAHSDMANLFESSQIATVFLDRTLSIRFFTPAVSQVFNILPSDRGRPLSDLNSSIPMPTLADDVKAVLSSGTPVELRVRSAAGDMDLLVRAIPYRGQNHDAEGVVVTFIDVTAVAKAPA
jgi:two-component system CheB/CheR fusion protein